MGLTPASHNESGGLSQHRQAPSFFYLYIFLNHLFIYLLFLFGAGGVGLGKTANLFVNVLDMVRH